MTAREDRDSVIEPAALKFPYHLPGELGEKGQVVLGIDDQRLARETGELIEIRHRTNGRPKPAQSVKINRWLKTLADVARGLPMPDYVGKVGRGVIEGGDLDPSIVGCAEEGITRAKAGSYDS